MDKKKINMLSKADSVEGQGVMSATHEQIRLVERGLGYKFNIFKNKIKICDICHYHTINPHYYFALPFVKAKSKTVCSVHFLPETVENSLNLYKPIKNIFYKYMISFYKKMDYLVTVNPYFIDRLAFYGIDRNKVSYIPNFVSEEEFFIINDKKKQQIKESYGISKDKFIVLSVGQLQTRKGIFDFIEIAKKMKDVQFIWAGGFSFGKITDGYEKIKKIVENPPSNVKFLGIVKRNKMNDLYNIANVMLLASYEELFPMTILESMNCGVPILLRDLEIYENILFDFYLKTTNVEGFIDTIKKLKENKDYHKTASSLSMKGNKFYSKDSVLDMWDKFYDGIING
ncbi:MAG: glycosyltransferase family 4 protein [Oscillospiraceae bacterium]